MQSPAIPHDEAARLVALRALRVLDTAAEERFDAITRTAKQLFRVPIALISLVDANRQWFKSRQGLDVPETPRDVSFCGHAILVDDAFVIEDARADARFHDNPLVTGKPHVVFYAGMPLAAPDGQKVGTLCLIDHTPRQFDAQARAQLRAIARWAERELLVTREAAAVAAARETQQYLEAVRDSVIDGIITITDAGIIEYVNPAAKRMFGYEDADLVGHNIRMLMPEPYSSAHDGYLQRYRETNERHVIGVGRTLVGRRNDGSAFPIDLVVTEVPLKSGRRFAGIVRDISERVAAEARMARALALKHAILDGAAYSIISTDPQGTILTFNHAAERLLGYNSAEIVGQTTPAIFHDSAEVVQRAAELTEELGRVVAPGFDAFVAKAVLGPPDEREWTYIRMDGSRFPVLLSITALRGADGGVMGFLGVGYDLTERRAVERAKQEFISTVSHELRTPLTSIVGSLGLVTGGAAGELPPRAATLLGIAHSNATRLVRLINDMLDIDKVTSGQMRFDMRPHGLPALLEHAVEANRAYATPLDVTLQLRAPVPDVMVSVDADRFAQVLSNLLSNAAKFSPSGTTVDVEATYAAGRVAIAVRDRGPGIPPEFHGRIFQKFSQADASDTRQKGGTGLGLSIAKAMVEGMHGTIAFASAPGSGTTFTVWLPASPAAPPLAGLGTTDSPFRAARVLVCEDDAEVARLLAIMLETEGYAAEVAGSAGEAWAWLRRASFDAITVDLGLPDRSGMDLIRELRDNPLTRDLPVIVVSANAARGRLALNGGFAVVDWINKPIDRVRLTAALHRALVTTGGRARVLYVEDDPDLREVVRNVLAHDADVMAVASVAEAEAALRLERYDLVLLDLGLPDGSGRDLLPLIQALRPTPAVLVFSGRDVPLEVERTVAATLAKTTTTNDELLATIRRLVHTDGGRAVTLAPQSPGPGTASHA